MGGRKPSPNIGHLGFGTPELGTSDFGSEDQDVELNAPQTVNNTKEALPLPTQPRESPLSDISTPPSTWRPMSSCEPEQSFEDVCTAAVMVQLPERTTEAFSEQYRNIRPDGYRLYNIKADYQTTKSTLDDIYRGLIYCCYPFTNLMATAWMENLIGGASSCPPATGQFVNEDSCLGEKGNISPFNEGLRVQCGENSLLNGATEQCFGSKSGFEKYGSHPVIPISITLSSWLRQKLQELNEDAKAEDFVAEEDVSEKIDILIHKAEGKSLLNDWSRLQPNQYDEITSSHSTNYGSLRETIAKENLGEGRLRPSRNPSDGLQKFILDFRRAHVKTVKYCDTRHAKDPF
ncbi:hypothetical protein FHETE_1373 [Fusarium heterosporum]|uniref:Uncharacterized protein n=1 Tax=Fusarium heterosporum TaxID=42747 RepID=A0A8H5TWU4_FUSHE|nr:hypothetical protein FHETE_1373 [Fusarium heterosporum]